MGVVLFFYGVVAGIALAFTFGAFLQGRDGRWLLAIILGIAALGAWGLFAGMIYDAYRTIRGDRPATRN